MTAASLAAALSESVATARRDAGLPPLPPPENRPWLAGAYTADEHRQMILDARAEDRADLGEPEPRQSDRAAERYAADLWSRS